MTNRLLPSALVLAGLLHGAAAQAFTAQIFFPPPQSPPKPGLPAFEPVGLAPVQGLWWSPGENGQFMQLAIGPGGYAFATLTESDPAGQPTYQVVQGQLQLADATQQGALASLHSNLYRIVDAGCLDCRGSTSNRTIDTGRAVLLQFRDVDRAELRGTDGRLLRSYQPFPLYNRAADQLAERLAGRRFLLTATVGGTREHALVQLQPSAGDARCADPALPGAREFTLAFEQPPLRSDRLARQFSQARLQVGSGSNPRIDLKTVVREGHCASVYRMQEDGEDLRGAALPGATAAVSADPAQALSYFSGALTLQALPRD